MSEKLNCRVCLQFSDAKGQLCGRKTTKKSATVTLGRDCRNILSIYVSIDEVRPYNSLRQLVNLELEPFAECIHEDKLQSLAYSHSRFHNSRHDASNIPPRQISRIYLLSNLATIHYAQNI